MNGQEKMVFGTRGGNLIPYPGIRQHGNTCVFASVGGAVNYLSQQQVWTEQSLLDGVSGTGARDATFGTVAPVAVSPVADLVEYSEHLDGEERKEPVETFLEILREHVTGGGIAIVSLERGARHATGPQRQGGWHMLTLIAREGELYQVWDSNDISAFVTEQELIMLDYPNGNLYIEHDRHHALLLRRKGNAK